MGGWAVSLANKINEQANAGQMSISQGTYFAALQCLNHNRMQPQSKVHGNSHKRAAYIPCCHEMQHRKTEHYNGQHAVAEANNSCRRPASVWINHQQKQKWCKDTATSLTQVNNKACRYIQVCSAGKKEFVSQKVRPKTALYVAGMNQHP